MNKVVKLGNSVGRPRKYNTEEERREAVKRTQQRAHKHIKQISVNEDLLPVIHEVQDMISEKYGFTLTITQTLHFVIKHYKDTQGAKRK